MFLVKSGILKGAQLNGFCLCFCTEHSTSGFEMGVIEGGCGCGCNPEHWDTHDVYQDANNAVP